jgi:hypothetical protein
MTTNTNIILNIPIKQTYSINDINETINFNTPHNLLNSFFINQKQSIRFNSYDNNLNENHSTDSHFLASSIGIFGLCRAFLVFVLLAPKK